MMRLPKQCMFVVALFAAWMLGAVAISAAETIFEVVPDDALALGVISHLDQTDAKIQKLGKQVQAPVPSLLPMAKAMLGIGKGFDDKGSMAAIVMPAESEGGEMVPVFLAPTTNFDELVKSLNPEKAEGKAQKIQVMGRDFLVGQRGSYAVFVESRNAKTIERMLKAEASKGGPLADVATWMAENDVAVALTPTGTKTFASQLRVKLKVLEESLKAVPNAAMTLSFYDRVLELAEKEVTTLAVGLRADSQSNLRLAKRVRFAADGKVAETLKPVPPNEAPLLDGLPGGPFVFAGGGVLPESWTRSLMGLSVAMFKQNPDLYGMTPEQVDKMMAISTQSMGHLKRFSMVLQSGRRGDPIYSNLLGVMHVDDAKAYLADYEKQMAAMNKLFEEAKESIMKPSKLTKIEIAGRPGYETAMNLPSPKPMPGMPDMGPMMEKLFGPSGKTMTYIVAADATVVAFGFNTSKDNVASLCEGIASSKAGFLADNDVVKTAGLLMPGAQAVGYVSPRGMVGMFGRMMSSMAPPQAKVPTIPEFPASPPVGLAVKTSAQQIDSEMVVPAAVIEAIGTYVMQIRRGEHPAAP